MEQTYKYAIGRYDVDGITGGGHTIQEAVELDLTAQQAKNLADMLANHGVVGVEIEALEPAGQDALAALYDSES